MRGFRTAPSRCSIKFEFVHGNGFANGAPAGTPADLAAISSLNSYMEMVFANGVRAGTQADPAAVEQA
jgi:hypothetical protein